NRNYEFSGGLDGVGVSVVHALSPRVEVAIRREGEIHRMGFAGGDRQTRLEDLGTVGKKNTGTTLRFWPDPKYFDSAKISLPRLKHVLRAKAVLCAGLAVSLKDEASGEEIRWLYEDGLRDYLRSMIGDAERLPAELFIGAQKREKSSVDFAIAWLPEGELTQESYVNLIPTAQG